jgi:FtsP/CotA-like multicopper oxidase with cupredoxin domain
MIDRRALLKSAAVTPLAAMAPRLGRAADSSATEKPGYTLRIATGLVELAPGRIVSTTLYNDAFPGPLLRFAEGKRVVVDVYNDTDSPELVHWRGQMIPSEVDGAAEEGAPYVQPHSMRRIAFTRKPSGFRFYHTHVVAGGDLNRGTYTGQVGLVYIEPKDNPGAYDREVFLGGKPTAGVIKDVVMLGGFQELEFDFFADNPGKTLFHCHQQLHMDFGFMAMFDYA